MLRLLASGWSVDEQASLYASALRANEPFSSHIPHDDIQGSCLPLFNDKMLLFLELAVCDIYLDGLRIVLATI